MTNTQNTEPTTAGTLPQDFFDRMNALHGPLEDKR
jgi:hypothetical protein